MWRAVVERKESIDRFYIIYIYGNLSLLDPAPPFKAKLIAQQVACIQYYSTLGYKIWVPITYSINTARTELQ